MKKDNIKRLAEYERQRQQHQQQRQQRQHPHPIILPPPSEPMEVAQELVDQYLTHDGALTLRNWRGGWWWWWQKSCWREVGPHEVRAALYKFTRHALYLGKTKPEPWAPNHHKIRDLLEALSAVVILPDNFNQPGWIDRGESGNIVAVGNGLLDVASRQLYPHTALYFNQTAVPFDYNPQAPKPTQWLTFLDELWPQTPEAIDVLAEWFGYVISGRTDLHKILLMVGPTRGGKGVIGRRLTDLVGKKNVCGPTLNSLGSNFGLAPLIGKPLAIISDARFSPKGGNIVVERLLSISGEDTLTVDRKYKDQWSGKLPTRIHIISNELPKLGDASTAVVGRIVLLLLTRSWLHKENLELEPRLQAELPAILNWALEGLGRLTSNDGRFTRLEAAEEAINAMRDLASPVGAFVREKCEVSAAREVECGTLYSAYKTWCEVNEHPKASMQLFGRDLRAAVPSVRRTRPRDGDDRINVYLGVGLRS